MSKKMKKNNSIKKKNTKSYEVLYLRKILIFPYDRTKIQEGTEVPPVTYDLKVYLHKKNKGRKEKRKERRF